MATDVIEMRTDNEPTQNDTEAVKQTRTRRLFSEEQLFALNLVMYGSWYFVGTNTYVVMLNGGPQTWLFSFFIVAIGVGCQAASFAEMASVYPIAGAQYFWTNNYAPTSVKVFLTWLQGWTTWLGYVSMLASNINGGIITLQGIINIAHPDWTPKGWQTTLMIIAYLVLCTSVNLWFFGAVPWFEVIAGILNVFLFFIVGIVCLVMAPRNSMDIFLTKSNAGGWNEFVSFNIGSAANLFLFIAFESTVHLGEETRGPKRAVPSSMFWGYVANAAMALIMIIIFGVVFPGIEAILGSVSPLATIISHATGSPSASVAILSCMLFCMFAASIGNLSSVSRLTWAWARDGGLPKYFAIVDGQTRVPMRAVCGTTFIVALLSLLYLNDQAFIALGAISSLSSISLYISYGIALICILYARCRSSGGFQLGEWNCGRFGLPVNIVALIYTAWEIPWLAVPNVLPVTVTNMNYAGPIYLAVLVGVVSYWFLWAKKNWTGPNMKIVGIVVRAS